jgi:hypothetical protein
MGMGSFLEKLFNQCHCLSQLCMPPSYELFHLGI